MQSKNLSAKGKKIDKKPKSMSLRELKEEELRLEKLLVDTSRLRTEYYRKLSWSFSPLIFILLGFPLAVITNKREKTANVVMAIIFAAVYYLLFMVCEALSLDQKVPPEVIMWVPNAIGFLTAVYLNLKINRG